MVTTLTSKRNISGSIPIKVRTQRNEIFQRSGSLSYQRVYGLHIAQVDTGNQGV